MPEVRDANGTWRRAHPGDGVAEALLDLLVRGSVPRNRFTVTSWAELTTSGERPVGVDQTNESVIVGDTAVVKWATNLQEGPHPAPRRISVLRNAGFAGMPAPWGMVTWRTPDGTDTLVASADEYLDGAVDGWTWAVDEIAAAARDGGHDGVTGAAAEVAALVAQLHSALAGTVTVATATDALRWRDAAFTAFETACASGDSTSTALLRARRIEVGAILEGLGGARGTGTR